PAKGDANAATLLLIVGVFTASLLVLFIGDADQRGAKLMEAVRIELNKIRRVYHLSKNLASGNQKYRQWFTDMHGYVYDYLAGFAGKDFESYDSYNASFRKLSYHIYTIPEVDSRKDEALFQELLRTAGTVAEARQQIKELWDNRLSAYGWSVVALLAGTFVVSVPFAMNGSFASRIVGGVSVMVLLLAVDYLREIDTMSGEKKAMAERYVDN